MPAGHDDARRERLEDLFQDFTEAYHRCENALIELEQSPNDRSIVDGLLRTLRTSRDNLLYAGMKDITPILQAVEALFDSIAKGNLSYDAVLSDVILLTLDRAHKRLEDTVAGQPTHPSALSVEQLSQAILRITAASDGSRTTAIQQALMLMDPALAIEVSPAIDRAVPTIVSTPGQIIPSSSDIASILDFFGVAMDEDMQFFISINVPLEARSLFWRGRTARQLGIAIAMNKEAGNPVPPSQLAAAVIMHDIGMAFLPVDLLHTKDRLSASALATLQAHPDVGHSLMKPLKRWDEAAQIILQHHERMDGTGYPARAAGNVLCEGAKILAIVDTFEARTHERAHTHMTKRPFIRAILEISSCAGTQFDARWVEHFNHVARAMTSQNAR